jgi:hypothetical protein
MWPLLSRVWVGVGWLSPQSAAHVESIARRYAKIAMLSLFASATIMFGTTFFTYSLLKQKKKIKITEIIADWEMTGPQIRLKGAELIKSQKMLDNSIASQDVDKATFGTTFGRMIALATLNDPIENAITFPKNVSADEKIREAAKQTEKVRSFDEFTSRIPA